MSNTLYNHCLKLINSISKDLDGLETGIAEDSSAIALAGRQGQLTASLLSLSRSLDDYESMAKRELDAAKKTKALARVKDFRTKLSQLRERFAEMKTQLEDVAHSRNRKELLSRRGFSHEKSENPYASSSAAAYATESNTASSMTRQQGLLHEDSFLNRAESQIDEYLERGRLVLGDLVEQGTMLKSTKRKILDAANTLGITRKTIAFINRRSRQDKILFVLGAIVTFTCFYLIVRWLR
ncbi:SNARE Bos1 [Schizosaccharomyces japonicus yFS275]|uniref:Protein transport protein BOS1 n=1 Tax=Schizosaccharomyces japonicus (strain yFS275 / FY16936) TaxID=402676 RepID=B6K710_SCHJY|nr:SNARE Bos1 [Schizosaccharomyces japonicus yFS275]EEB09314.1 SNARE Bos1 [Schizosaccharomyces japonicus yFS275]